MTAAAFQATYSDWKVIKGRKVVQVVFELPLEKADEAYRVLGGMPVAASEHWCAIARLEQKTAPERPARRSFDELSPAQQSGILCNEVAFAKFLQERHREVWMRCDDLNDQRRSANVIRELCNVDSRADLKPENSEWTSLVLAYRLWQREPEFV